MSFDLLYGCYLDRFWRELGTVFDRISADPNVRAVVLASALPKMFTAGLDCTYSFPFPPYLNLLV